MRVLVVEDEPIIALNIQAVLLDLGYRPVGPATSLEEATTLIGHRKFDAAILDVTLPDGDSYDLAETLLDRNVPIIFATGRHVDSASPRLAAVPALSKPFDLTALEKALEAIRFRVMGRETGDETTACL